MTYNYGTLTDALAYHADRGNAAWAAAASDAVRQEALNVASEYIDRKYVDGFGGLKVGLRAQIPEWPRTGARDWYGYAILQTDIPIEVINATYEAALVQVTSPGALNVTFNQSQMIKSVSVYQAINVSYTGAFSASDAQNIYPLIDRAIAPVLVGNGDGMTSVLTGSSSR